MNLRDYSILHFDIIKVQEQRFYCCPAFHSHNSVFNSEQISSPENECETVSSLHLRGCQQKCQQYFFLSMCDVKVSLTFTSPSLVLL